MTPRKDGLKTKTLGGDCSPPRVDSSNGIKSRYAFLFDEPQHAFASLQQSAPSMQHF